MKLINMLEKKLKNVQDIVHGQDFVIVGVIVAFLFREIIPPLPTLA